MLIKSQLKQVFCTLIVLIILDAGRAIYIKNEEQQLQALEQQQQLDQQASQQQPQQQPLHSAANQPLHGLQQQLATNQFAPLTTIRIHSSNSLQPNGHVQVYQLNGLPSKQQLSELLLQSIDAPANAGLSQQLSNAFAATTNQMQFELNQQQQPRHNYPQQQQQQQQQGHHQHYRQRVVWQQPHQVLQQNPQIFVQHSLFSNSNGPIYSPDQQQHHYSYHWEYEE